MKAEETRKKIMAELNNEWNGESVFSADMKTKPKMFMPKSINHSINVEASDSQVFKGIGFKSNTSKIGINDSYEIYNMKEFINSNPIGSKAALDVIKQFEGRKIIVTPGMVELGKEEANLVGGARAPYDAGRPVGSSERGTDMDHTVSAGEIIRDPAAAAHLTQEERVAFANSDANLNELDSSLNRSKKDTPMTDWLDTPNKNGQKPSEIFDITDGTIVRSLYE